MFYTDSMEYKVEAIYYSKTKEYFSEVLSSYNNGNYRSAIVMLYSVVICDLVYKLQELSDRYSDDTAESILKQVKEEKKESSTNPKWEVTLITQIKERTNLFESQDSLNLDYLRSQRHLSAHPVLDQLDMLVKPNKETTRANIVNMLDGILCKSPLLSKRMISTFLEDLVSVKDQLIKDVDFEKYLNSKYLSKINKPTADKLFRDLWKFVFRLDDQQTSENREVIYRALLVLYKKDMSSFNSQIEGDKSYYSLVNLEDEAILNYILQFWSIHPLVFQYMDQSIGVMIKTKGEKNLDILSKSVFLSDTLEQHFEIIQSKLIREDLRLSDSARKLLFLLSENQGSLDNFLDFLIELLKHSSSYDDSNDNFQDYILTYGDIFSKDQFIKILDIINENSQLHNRRQAKTDNNSLQRLIEIRFEGEIDYTKYPYFRI
ncbi:hypothetical protein [Oceanobacillus sp. ISL-73]|uniref:hypothetical protein n=1 Tax=Oceanobacillus sp. ISL-73 TaxID=2819161 RepID=UPI001BEABF29|nr:hypothetical protein [Oceanobacillus sp. ISL-73]MBT2653221.1 hypothetical protein [Oceanobacillus sp. ISL-73]